MFQISKRSMATFERESSHSSQLAMATHYRDFFPWHSRAWGPEATAKVLEHGREQAARHGFETRRDVCLYLTLLPLLGSWFDKDAQLPWAGQILADENRSVRAHHLASRALSHVVRVQGSDYGKFLAALTTASKELVGLLEDRTIADGRTHARAMLRRLWPRKYEAHKVSTLIHEGLVRASEHRLNNRRGQLLVIALMFLFGTGFDRDPQFPAFAESVKLGPDALQIATLEVLERWIAASHEGGHHAEW
jgi:hypothetical protein